MKRLLFFPIVFFAILTLFSSCRKDFTCECTVDGELYLYNYDDEKNKSAKDACDAQQAAAQIIDKSAKCEFKTK